MISRVSNPPPAPWPPCQYSFAQKTISCPTSSHESTDWLTDTHTLDTHIAPILYNLFITFGLQNHTEPCSIYTFSVKITLVWRSLLILFISCMGDTINTVQNTEFLNLSAKCMDGFKTGWNVKITLLTPSPLYLSKWIFTHGQLWRLRTGSIQFYWRKSCLLPSHKIMVWEIMG